MERRSALGIMIHWVEGARQRPDLRAGLARGGRGEREGRRRRTREGACISTGFTLLRERGEGASSKALEACEAGKAERGGRR